MTALALRSSSRAALRGVVIATTAFLTLVDLFATQAIAPMLAQRYEVSAGAMGVAVNAATIGMAIASLLVALFSDRIDRRAGILFSLLLLSIPTALLAIAPNLAVFAALRIAQGLCMATAFTLTLAYLGDQASGSGAAGAFAAYITGNVASNLIGRMLSAGIADHAGLSASFLAFAALNVAGGALVYWTIERTPRLQAAACPKAPWAAVAAHLRNPALAAAVLLGFSILFAFIGVFTYVNFLLAGPEVGLGMMALGLVYLVFAPSILTTPLAGWGVARLGVRPAIWLGLGLAGLGLLGLATRDLTAILAGMTAVGVGTFFAQAAATGFVGRAATTDRSAASGLYLAGYFAGGLAGAWSLGVVYESQGWNGCLVGVALALAVGAVLTFWLRLRDD